MKKLLLISLFAGLAVSAWSQGFAFGVKGGLTLGLQSWSGFEMDPAIKYHGILFIESAPEEDKFSLFAQAGYHVKGSALRNRNFLNQNGDFFRPPTYEFLFNNISLTLGAKQKYKLTQRMKAYYLFGIRGDYSLGNNFDEYEDYYQLSGFFPYDEPSFIREITYGITLGGGLEWPVWDLVGVLLEFTVNPDFSYQYIQPEIPNVRDPYTGQSRTLPDRQIRNTTFEITLGLRFLRRVIYID